MIGIALRAECSAADKLPWDWVTRHSPGWFWGLCARFEEWLWGAPGAVSGQLMMESLTPRHVRRAALSTLARRETKHNRKPSERLSWDAKPLLLGLCRSTALPLTSVLCENRCGEENYIFWNEKAGTTWKISDRRVVWRRIIVFCGSWKPSGLASHMMSVIVNLERAVVRNLQLSTTSEMHLCVVFVFETRWPNERNCSRKKLNCSLKIQLNPHAIGNREEISCCRKMVTNGSRLRLRKCRLRA